MVYKAIDQSSRYSEWKKGVKYSMLPFTLKGAGAHAFGGLYQISFGKIHMKLLTQGLFGGKITW